MALSRYSRIEEKVAVIVFATGMPRTGTKSVSVFFGRAGIESHHQPNSLIVNERQLESYDLANPPNWLLERVNRKNYTGNYVDSCWTNIYAFYLLERKFPEAEFLLLLRGVEAVSNSLKALRELRPNAAVRPVSYYADAWLRGYEFVLRQIEIMKKPFLLEFDQYVAGRYTDFLLSLFDVRDGPSRMRAALSLKTKANYRGDYFVHPIDADRRASAEIIANRLRGVCNEPRVKVPSDIS